MHTYAKQLLNFVGKPSRDNNMLFLNPFRQVSFQRWISDKPGSSEYANKPWKATKRTLRPSMSQSINRDRYTGSERRSPSPPRWQDGFAKSQERADNRDPRRSSSSDNWHETEHRGRFQKTERGGYSNRDIGQQGGRTERRIEGEGSSNVRPWQPPRQTPAPWRTGVSKSVGSADRKGFTRNDKDSKTRKAQFPDSRQGKLPWQDRASLTPDGRGRSRGEEGRRQVRAGRGSNLDTAVRRRAEQEGSIGEEGGRKPPPVILPHELQTSDWWEREGLGLPPPSSPAPSSSSPSSSLDSAPRHFPGERKEEKWHRKMARKREKRLLEAESQPSFESFVAREMDPAAWRAAKMKWVVEEMVVMRPNPLVKLMNAQRAWITMEDVKEIIHTLLDRGEGLRAVRVLKWCRQMEWYVPDFGVYSRLAEAMADASKLSRSTELYDMMLTHRMVPGPATFERVISALVREGQTPEVEAAWKMYRRMRQLAGHTPSLRLHKLLFEAMSEGPWNLRFVSRAEQVLRDMQGHPEPSDRTAAAAMYARLCQLAGRRGDVGKAESLVGEMREAGMTPPREAMAAVVHACGSAAQKDHIFAGVGQAEEGEEGGRAEGKGGQHVGRRAADKEQLGRWREGLADRAQAGFRAFREAGFTPDPALYASLMQALLQAGQGSQVEPLLQELKGSGLMPSAACCLAGVQAHAALGEEEKARGLLGFMKEADTGSLQEGWNALLDLLARQGRVQDVRAEMERMQGSGQCHPDAHSHGALVRAHLVQGELGEAWNVYQKMKAKGGVGVDASTCQALIGALAGAEGQGEEGKRRVEEAYKDLQGVAGSRKLPAEVREALRRTVGDGQVAADERARLRLVTGQREVLVGVLLGGAQVETFDGERTYSVRFEQRLDDPAKARLMEHLYGLFADWALNPPQEKVVSAGADDTQDPADPLRIVYFVTVNHGSFRFYAHQYYPDGKPVIPRLIHRWLSPRALAYWYMFGGARCRATGGIILNAKQYSAREVKLVVAALKGRAIECERRKRKSGDVVRFTGKSAEWLWKLMEPYVIPEMVDALKPTSRGEARRGEVGRGGDESEGIVGGKAEESRPGKVVLKNDEDEDEDEEEEEEEDVDDSDDDETAWMPLEKAAEMEKAKSVAAKKPKRRLSK